MSELASQEIRHVIGAQGSLVLHDVSGSVRVRGTDTDEARVVARGDHGDRNPRLTVRKSDGALHIEPERRGPSFLGASIGRSDGIDFDVELPRTARVEINTVSADVDAAELVGEQRYRTVSGDVVLDRLAGRVSVTTVSGDVRLATTDPLELDGTTTSGDIKVDAGELRLVRIRSVSGDARIAGSFLEGPEHGMETVSGDLVLEPRTGLTVEPRRALEVTGNGGRPIVVGDGAARFRFRSMSGDVRVAGKPRTREAPATRAEQKDSLAILRALESGEIDVDEATRRLEEVGNRA